MPSAFLAALVAAAAMGAPAPEAAEQRPLRVLVMAGSPTREYQFVRTLFANAVHRKQAELSIYLQGARAAGVVQEVPPERLLSRFPDRLQDRPDDRAEEKFSNLARYDVVIAFDPDWTQLKAEQQVLLEKWVKDHSGGLIVIGGPLNTFRLAQQNAREALGPILDLHPVVPKDTRIEKERSTNEPWRLNFRSETGELTFLRLDAERKAALAGWEDFFTDSPKQDGEKRDLVRGFYNFHPVEGIKAGATVLATFGDPKARLADGKEQPYLVTRPYGKGRVIWLGSGETWRLRQYRPEYHERFWELLSRYAAGSG